MKSPWFCLVFCQTSPGEASGGSIKTHTAKEFKNEIGFN